MPFRVVFHRDAGAGGRHEGPSLEVTAAALVAGEITPVDVSDQATAQMSALPLIHSSADPDVVRAAQATCGKAHIAAAFEEFFAERARVARGVACLITAGGETSGASDQARNRRRRSGVPAFRAGDDLVLGLKSGNFAAPHFFATAARVLRGAVVRLHSTHSTALLVLRETDPDNPLPPLTTYSAMRLGKMTLLPYYGLGDPAAGDAVRGLAGERSAVVLANRGPVVAAKDMEAAVDAVEELEEKTHALSCCGVGEPSDAER